MSWRNLIWMAIILSLAGLALLLAHQQRAGVAPSDPAVEDLAPAVEAYKLIQAHGYGDFPPQRAWQGAIEGMARQVDEYSHYLSPGDGDRLDLGLTGTRFGTGLRIAESAGRLLTIGALPDAPAAKAGIGSDLEILTIDDVEAKYFSLADARRRLRRPVDGHVAVRLRKPGGEETVHRLSPGFYEVPTVTGLVRDAEGKWVYALDAEAGTYYLRVTEFSPRRSVREFHQAYRSCEKPRGIVLDLRDNPGGYLQAAAVLVDRFLDGGVIVRSVTRKGQTYVHHAHPAGTYPPVALVVLVNERTASAAEIAAGALQAHRRAALVGRRTRGKFYVQSPIPLSGDRGILYLTTAEYFLGAPATRPATATAPAATASAPRREPGIQPDVDVRLTARARRRLRLLRTQASVQPPPAPATTTRPAAEPAPHEKLRDAILATDAQLAEALALLKRRRAPSTRPAGPTTTGPEVREVGP